ncbi:hypothetical protein [Pseudomonas nabeulensis]|uniref:hypothetical protein n=1 Tax=Pseudomonas nabeulensis TaxID=2293833 RepID=UPI001075D770|nr:hypothetical protein [Pseudomonas nabeulensis]
MNAPKSQNTGSRGKKSHFFRGVSVKKAELLKLEDAFICGAKSDSARLLKTRKQILEEFTLKAPEDPEVRYRIEQIEEALLEVKKADKAIRKAHHASSTNPSSKYDGAPDLGIKTKPRSTNATPAKVVSGGGTSLGRRA